MQVETQVLTVLSNSKAAGRLLTLPGQLDRKLYERTNKVLEAAGGKWDRGSKAHVFDRDAADAMEQIILTGAVTVPQDFGYFPTPPAVVATLLARAGIRPGMRCLEPEAGRGAIACELRKAGGIVDVIELLDANFDDLCKVGPWNEALHGDFLEIVPAREYDRVVMNPPFAKQADIKHVMHALQFVKPGGRLDAVMSAGVTFRDNRLGREFRELVDDHGGEIEELPEAAFKASGTMVRTVVVSIPC